MRSAGYIIPWLLIITSVAFATDQDRRAATACEKVVNPALDRETLFKQFKQTLSGVKLVGKFTVTGKDDAPLREEEYTIESVEKHPEGDFWIFVARIKYGEKDVKLPLKLEVKWADTTPVITLTDLAIPGLGTFSSRVVIHDGKYVGTWSHGAVGGHLFGVIKKLPVGDESPAKTG